MSATIDLMERQFRKTMDWKTRVTSNPLPYVAGALVVVYLLVGGPRRTAGFIASRRPRKKTRLEELVEQLPDPIAERIAPGVRRAMDKLEDLPDDLRKAAREAQKERDKQLQKEDEARLKRAARATMTERILVKVAEAAGTAAAGFAVKRLSDRLFKEEK